MRERRSGGGVDWIELEHVFEGGEVHALEPSSQPSTRNHKQTCISRPSRSVTLNMVAIHDALP